MSKKAKELQWSEDSNGHLVAKGKHNYLIDKTIVSLHPLYSINGDKHHTLCARRTIEECQAVAQEIEDEKA